MMTLMQREVADYEAYATDHSVGALVRGRVRAVAPFGVFVELAPNVQGLLEVLDFAVGAPKRFPEDYPQIGTSIEAAIKYFDVPTMNIRLTQRPSESAE
jgi:small subunit ribosomal protein S1